MKGIKKQLLEEQLEHDMSQFDDMDYEYHLNNSINQNNNKMSKTKTEKTETKETRKGQEGYLKKTI